MLSVRRSLAFPATGVLTILFALSVSEPAPSQAPVDPGCHVQALTPRLAPSKRYVYERATARCDQTTEGLFEYALLWRPRGGKPRRIADGEGISMTFVAGQLYSGGGVRGRNWTLLCVRAIHAGPPRRTTSPLRGGRFATNARLYAQDGRLLEARTSTWVRNRCPTPPRTVHVK